MKLKNNKKFKKLDEKGLREWMNKYHDDFVVANNKLNAIKRILEGEELEHKKEMKR